MHPGLQGFLALLFLGELFIFAKEGPVNSAMLWSVEDELKVREHSAAVERCGPHIANSPVMVRSSNASRTSSSRTRW